MDILLTLGVLVVFAGVLLLAAWPIVRWRTRSNRYSNHRR